MKKTILCFFGTRPEAIKMAPVVKKLQADPRFRVRVCVSAQHRDMLDQVLKTFRINSSIDLNLMKPGQSLSDITVRVLERLGPVLKRVKPDLVLVHGDTTTTLAGAMAAFYHQIPVGHVEAGLRTNDLARPYPEEANRQLTDALTTLYFCPTQESRRNLLKENRKPKNIFVTGNTVIDALFDTLKSRQTILNGALKKILVNIKLNKHRLILMTAHRRENFGRPFERVLAGVLELAKKFPDVHWIYPVHLNPNVHGPAHRVLGKQSNIHLVHPLGYADLVQTMKLSALVVTDSGGLQEEAPSLGKPVLVLRDVTERPEAVRAGTVLLVGTDKNKLVRQTSRLLTDPIYYRRMASAMNPYGDGKAAPRIVQAIRRYLA